MQPIPKKTKHICVGVCLLMIVAGSVFALRQGDQKASWTEMAQELRQKSPFDPRAQSAAKEFDEMAESASQTRLIAFVMVGMFALGLIAMLKVPVAEDAPDAGS